MKEKMIIKKVDKNNFAEFEDLIGEFARYQKLKIPEKAAMLRLKKDGQGKNPKYVAYLGTVNDKPVSFATTLMMYSSFKGLPVLYIEDLFVLEEFRRKGMGQQMFEYCVRVAQKKDCCRLDWWGLTKSKSAMNFYKKNKAKKLEEAYFRLEGDQLNKFKFSK